MSHIGFVIDAPEARLGLAVHELLDGSTVRAMSLLIRNHPSGLESRLHSIVNGQIPNCWEVV